MRNLFAAIELRVNDYSSGVKHRRTGPKSSFAIPGGSSLDKSIQPDDGDVRYVGEAFPDPWKD
jgi:hypothetical protein